MQTKFEVLFEDNHLLVINKPTLLPTMGVKSGQESLVTLCKSYLKEKYNKPGNVFLGVVSRLDSFVSGVIVLARTSKAASRLNEQFASSKSQKEYTAIVSGNLPNSTDRLTHWVIKDEKNHKMKTVSRKVTGAKNAILDYECKGQFGDWSLVKIQLHTGRKHQIRTQLTSIGCPILGDRKYGSRQTFARGIALHSTNLTITHPTQDRSIEFKCPPPVYWKINRFK